MPDHLLHEMLDDECRFFEDHFNILADAALLLVDGKVIDLNGVAEALFGIPKPDFLHKSPADLSPDFQPDGVVSSEKFCAMMQLCMESGTHRFEWLHRHAAGKVFWVDAVLTKLIRKGHTFIFASLRDITKRKEDEAMIINQQNQLASANNTLNQRYEEELRLRQELEYYKSRLERRVKIEVEKNREKDRLLHNQSKHIQMGEMLSMIAHQWRQPLSAISASAISVSMKQEIGMLTSEMVSEHSAFVQKHAQAMSRTINDFMDFFKPEHEQQHFGVSELMAEIESLIGVQLSSRGLQLRCSEPPKEPIYGYRNELAHVMINLIANARDAYEGTSNSEKVIDVGIRYDGKEWHITVEDYAGGIPEEHMEKIFNPYFTTKEQGKGTGIGLYMSRRIVEEVFLGVFRVENTEAGARFSIVFPSTM